jgi:hypothetical protein
LSTAAPAITLTAIVSKRTISLNDVAVPTLLLLFDQGTSATLNPVIRPVRERWPTAAEVQIANVVDLRKFPRIVHKIAEQLMKNSYAENARSVESPRDPADYVIIVPDWQAKVMKAVGIETVSERLALAVVAPGGRLIGAAQGDDAPQRAIAMLAEAMGAQ